MLTTENAFVALQLSQTMNSPSSNNMMKPKPIVAQGNCHDSILLGNVNDAMEVAPHNPMMYNDASRIQSSLPDPQFLRGHLAENDRHSVASGVGNEEGGLLRVLSQTLDRSQQDFLCSLFTVAQRVSPSEELADMGDNNVQNEPLPWRTETAMPRETPAIPDCELHQSKSAALPGKTCDEIDAQERADTRSIDEVPAEEPTAWNVASPRATPAPIGETSAVLPAEELVAAEDDLTCTEHDESSKAKALVCVVDPVTKTNDNVDFSMTVKLQTVLAEIK